MRDMFFCFCLSVPSSITTACGTLFTDPRGVTKGAGGTISKPTVCWVRVRVLQERGREGALLEHLDPHYSRKHTDVETQTHSDMPPPFRGALEENKKERG